MTTLIAYYCNLVCLGLVHSSCFINKGLDEVFPLLHWVVWSISHKHSIYQKYRCPWNASRAAILPSITRLLNNEFVIKSFHYTAGKYKSCIVLYTFTWCWPIAPQFLLHGILILPVSCYSFIVHGCFSESSNFLLNLWFSHINCPIKELCRTKLGVK